MAATDFGDPNGGRADGGPRLTLRASVRGRLCLLLVTVAFVGCGTASEPSADGTPTATATAPESPSAIATPGPPASPSDPVEATIEPSPTVEPTVAATPAPTPTRKPVVTPKPTPRPTKMPAPSWSINAQIDKTRYWNDPGWLLIYIVVSGTVPKDATSAEYDLSCDMSLTRPDGSFSNHFSGTGTNGYTGPSFGWNFYGPWGQASVGVSHWTIDCYNTTGSPRYEHRSDSGSITVPPDASPAP